jgi:undecaprenyl-diphosphatase
MLAGRARSLVRQEFVPLALVALLAGSVWLFIGIADEVFEGQTHAIDTDILLALRAPGDPGDPLGPVWLENLVRDVSALGGTGILAFIAAAAALYLILRRKLRAALFVALSVSGGMALSFALKAGFDRPRPDLVPHGDIVSTASFPSGHSMMSALVYLTLGGLLARFQPNRRLKAYVLALAILMTAAIGASRVYLGVHWPTDVLAGWAAGAAGATAAWFAAHWLQRRRKIESAEEGNGTA